jgi:hypothetical protein
MATAAVIAGSAASGGGLTAITVGLFRRKGRINKFPENETEEVHNGDDHERDGKNESGIAE